MNNRSFFSAFVFLFLISCEAFVGDEKGRAEFSRISNLENSEIKSIELELEQYDELHFWSDMDIKYENEPGLRFLVKMYLNGQVDEEFAINPFEQDLSLNSEKETSEGITHWKFEGRNLIINIQEDGNYKFEVMLVSTENKPLEIMKSDLVIRM